MKQFREMKVTGLVLALIVASVAEAEPTRAQAFVYSHSQDEYVGTFDFDQADSSGMLRVNALSITLIPGEYVVVANTIPNAEGQCICPKSYNRKPDFWPENYEGERISFKIFTMKVYEDLSHDVHNILTSATLSHNHTNSILNGVIAIYYASTFKEDQSISMYSSIVACGEVTMYAKATLFFNDVSKVDEYHEVYGKEPLVAGTLEVTGSIVGDPSTTDVHGSFNGVQPGTYYLILYSNETTFTDCDSLTLEGVPAHHILTSDIDGTIEFSTVFSGSTDWYLKVNDEESVSGHPVALFEHYSNWADAPDDQRCIACGVFYYE